MNYIFFLVSSSLLALLFVQYRSIVAVIGRLREGCFIYLPYHAAPKYLSLKERNFDLEEIPTYFFVLLFLHEDDRFLIHKGFNAPEITKALTDSLLRGCWRGGSSITQQTAKSLFTDGKLSLKRKVLETLGTIALERNLTKEEILYLYLSNLKSVSIVSGLPDILKYLLEIEHPGEMSIDEAEFIISLIPAPTARITKIRVSGIKAYNFNYSYEKILLLMRAFKNKQIEENYRGFARYQEVIREELLPHSSIYRVDSLQAEEVDSIVKASVFMGRIQRSLDKIALKSLPKISPRYLLTNWQSALIELINQNSNSIAFRLNEAEERRIIQLARKSNLLHLLSINKAINWGLDCLVGAIRIESQVIKHDRALNSDIKYLVTTLSGEEIADEAFRAPHFGESIEHFFSLS